MDLALTTVELIAGGTSSPKYLEVEWVPSLTNYNFLAGDTGAIYVSLSGEESDYLPVKSGSGTNTTVLGSNTTIDVELITIVHRPPLRFLWNFFSGVSDLGYSYQMNAARLHCQDTLNGLIETTATHAWGNDLSDASYLAREGSTVSSKGLYGTMDQTDFCGVNMTGCLPVPTNANHTQYIVENYIEVATVGSGHAGCIGRRKMWKTLQHPENPSGATTYGSCFQGDADKWTARLMYDAFANTSDARASRMTAFQNNNVISTDRARPFDGLVANIHTAAWDMRWLAPLYPSKFMLFGGEDQTQYKNYVSIWGRIIEGRYLSGVMLGGYLQHLLDLGELRNNQGEIITDPTEVRLGFVAAWHWGGVRRGINAFKMGLNLINPEFDVLVIYTQDFGARRRNRIASRYLMDRYGVLAVTQHQDDDESMKMARDMGKVSVGYNLDMSATVGGNSVLTSIIVEARDETLMVLKSWVRHHRKARQEYSRRAQEGGTTSYRDLMGEIPYEFAYQSWYRGNSVDRKTYSMASVSQLVPPAVLSLFRREQARLWRGDDMTLCGGSTLRNPGGPLPPDRGTFSRNYGITFGNYLPNIHKDLYDSTLGNRTAYPNSRGVNEEMDTTGSYNFDPNLVFTERTDGETGENFFCVDVDNGAWKNQELLLVGVADSCTENDTVGGRPNYAWRQEKRVGEAGRLSAAEFALKVRRGEVEPTMVSYEKITVPGKSDEQCLLGALVNNAQFARNDPYWSSTVGAQNRYHDWSADDASSSSGYYCPPGRELRGFDNTKLNAASVCLPCERGFYAPNDKELHNKDLGTVLEPSQYVSIDEECVSAGLGHFVAQEGAHQQELCPKGSSANVTGMKMCNLCSTGTYAAEVGSYRCIECSEGSYSNTEGMSRCNLCDIGRYENRIGSSQCRQCPSGMTTAIQGADTDADCLCPEGRFKSSVFDFHYVQNNGTVILTTNTTVNGGTTNVINGPESEQLNTNDCVVCHEGVSCRWGGTTGGKAVTILRSRPSYMVTKEFLQEQRDITRENKMSRSLSAYKCTSVQACPGRVVLNIENLNTPFADTCPPYASGVSCGMCQQDYFWSGDDGCEKCGSGSQAGGFFSLSLVMLLAVGVLWIRSTTNYNPHEIVTLELHAWVVQTKITTGISLLIDHAQTFFMIGSIGRDRKSYVAASELLNLQGMKKLQCLFPDSLDSRDAEVWRSLLTNCMPLFLIGILVALYHITRIDALKVPAAWLPHKVFMVIIIFAALETFFQSLMLNALGSFECYSHPEEGDFGDKSSLRLQPSIMCWEATHSSMVVVTMIFVLLWGVGYVGVLVKMFIQVAANGIPKDLFKARLMLPYFSRFEDRYFYWSLVLLLRRFLVASLRIFFSGDVDAQLLFLQILLLACVSLNQMCRPYRFDVLARADTIPMCLQLIISFLVAASQKSAAAAHISEQEERISQGGNVGGIGGGDTITGGPTSSNTMTMLLNVTVTSSDLTTFSFHDTADHNDVFVDMADFLLFFAYLLIGVNILKSLFNYKLAVDEEKRLIAEMRTGEKMLQVMPDTELTKGYLEESTRKRKLRMRMQTGGVSLALPISPNEPIPRYREPLVQFLMVLVKHCHEDLLMAKEKRLAQKQMKSKLVHDSNTNDNVQEGDGDLTSPTSSDQIGPNANITGGGFTKWQYGGPKEGKHHRIDSEVIENCSEIGDLLHGNSLDHYLEQNLEVLKLRNTVSLSTTVTTAKLEGEHSATNDNLLPDASPLPGQLDANPNFGGSAQINNSSLLSSRKFRHNKTGELMTPQALRMEATSILESMSDNTLHALDLLEEALTIANAAPRSRLLRLARERGNFTHVEPAGMHQLLQLCVDAEESGNRGNRRRRSEDNPNSGRLSDKMNIGAAKALIDSEKARIRKLKTAIAQKGARTLLKPFELFNEPQTPLALKTLDKLGLQGTVMGSMKTKEFGVEKSTESNNTVLSTLAEPGLESITEEDMELAFGATYSLEMGG